MSRATPDDQLKFLLSCVKHSNNGKIDFTEVAHECGVVSKGAAAKRYERLMKSNGINPNGGPDPKPTPLNPSRVRKNSTRPRAPRAPKAPQAPKASKQRAAQRRRVSHAVVKKPGDSVPPTPEPEPPEKTRVESSSFLPTNLFPIPAPQEHRSDPVQTQMQTQMQMPIPISIQHEDGLLDFNEFCSPEMFANCPTEIQQIRSEEATLLPVSGPHTRSEILSPKQQVQKPPQLVEERQRVEKQPERETVVIAD